MIRNFTIMLVIAGCLLGSCASISDPATEMHALQEMQNCAALPDPARSTFVIHEVKSNQSHVCNAGRASQRFVPASTFKVPHAIIAMESGVVTDEKLQFRWDGRPRGVKAWDKDTSLAESVAASTVWVFQSIATNLGVDRERAAVRRLGYGNAETGGAADLRQFWLTGPLKISATEQIAFFRKLRTVSLAADPKVQARTIAMLRLRGCGADCTVYGKTGAVLAIDNDGVLNADTAPPLKPGTERTGWFVGWVDRPDVSGGPLIFAYNVDLEVPGAMASRTQVVYDLMRAYGVRIE